MMNKLEKRYLCAKRALFDRLYGSLNECQRKAVFTTEGPLLVLAGAGSGKTTVLVQRIAYILKYGNSYMSEKIPPYLSEEEVSSLESVADAEPAELEQLLAQYREAPCPPWKVLAITFTNKAANEIKERLTAAVGESAADIWAGTFHSICVRILRKYGERIGYSRDFTIYDKDDSKKAIAACMKNLGIDEKAVTPKSLMNAISNAKNNLVDVSELTAGNDYRMAQVAKVYAAYTAMLADANALDFDDLLLQTVKLLRQENDVLAYYREHFSYICIDEFQDTNKVQLAFAILLTGERKNIMVVGDDDQSIYKFRGATIENILNFDKLFSDAAVVKLEQNYRSTKNILGAANAVIAHNTSRHDKKLWTNGEDGEKLRLVKLENQFSEAKFITDTILAGTAKGASFGDYAVLYRMNSQSVSIESTFAKSGISYRIYGGTRFFDREEIKDIIAYLCLTVNRSDNLRLMRIINKPRRKIGETTVSAVAEIAAAEHISMLDVADNAGTYSALIRVRENLDAFSQIMKRLTAIQRTQSVAQTIEAAIQLSGYSDMLASAGGSEAQDRLENIKELVSLAVEYEKGAEEPSLAGFLEDVALVSDTDSYSGSANAVTLMTVHSAKGLEFDTVFLPGMEDGIFPNSQAAESTEDTEEERRLAYVAITRAKRRLYLLHVRERLLFGRTQYNPLSGFVEEIPAEYIDDDGETAQSGFEPYRIRTAQAAGASNLSVKPRWTAAVLSAGENVYHPSFGNGYILTASPIGSDMLYEVVFDKFGTKKLLGSYARLEKR